MKYIIFFFCSLYYSTRLNLQVIHCNLRFNLFQIYKYTHNQEIATSSTAQMLSNMLYAKRFFPYYVSNVLVNILVQNK